MTSNDLLQTANDLGITVEELESQLNLKQQQQSTLPEAFRQTDDQLMNSIREESRAAKLSEQRKAEPVTTPETQVKTGVSSPKLNLDLNGDTAADAQTQAQIENDALATQIDRTLELAKQERYKATEVRNVLSATGLNPDQTDSMLRQIPEDLQIATARLSALRRSQALFKGKQSTVAGEFARNLVSAWAGDPFADRIKDAKAEADELTKNFKGADDVRKRLQAALADTNPAFVENRVTGLERDAAKLAVAGTAGRILNAETISARDSIIEDFKANHPNDVLGLTEEEILVKARAAGIDDKRQATARKEAREDTRIDLEKKRQQSQKGRDKLAKDKFAFEKTDKAANRKDQQGRDTLARDRFTFDKGEKGKTRAERVLDRKLNERRVKVSEDNLKIAQKELDQANSPEERELKKQKVKLAQDKLKADKARTNLEFDKLRFARRELATKGSTYGSAVTKAKEREVNAHENAVAKARAVVVQVAQINRANNARGKKPISGKALEDLIAISEGRKPIRVKHQDIGKISESVGNVIMSAESANNGYTAVVGEVDGEPTLTSMSMKDVVKFQKERKAKGLGTPVGKYQFIASTFKETYKKMGIPEDTVFDENIQEEMGLFLMRQAGLDKYLRSSRKTKDKEAFVNGLSKVWAGLPNTKGVTHYPKSNSARVELSEVYDSIAAMDTLIDQHDSVGIRDIDVLITEVESKIKNPVETSKREKEVKAADDKAVKVADLSSAIGHSGNSDVFTSHRNDINISANGSYVGSRSEALKIFDKDVVPKLSESSNLMLSVVLTNQGAIDPSLSLNPERLTRGNSVSTKISRRFVNGAGVMDETAISTRSLGYDEPIVGHSFFIGDVPLLTPGFGDEFRKKFNSSNAPSVKDIMETATAQESDPLKAASLVNQYFREIRRIKVNSPLLRFLKEPQMGNAVVTLKNKYISGVSVIHLEHDRHKIATLIQRESRTLEVPDVVKSFRNTIGAIGEIELPDFVRDANKVLGTGR